MRRMSPVKIALTGVSIAALTAGGAYAASSSVDEGDGETTTVVNKNGHAVDEHAADGQARAAVARAAAADKKAAKPDKSEDAEEAPAAEEVDEPGDDNGNHGGPNDAAGDHPNENAFLNPQDHEPQGPKEDHTSNVGGLGPDEHAADHPNEHATSDDKGGKK